MQRVAQKLIACALVALLAPMSGDHSRAMREFNRPFTFSADRFQTGDVIFRRGIGVLSQAVLAADRDGAYSHVGLIWRTADGVSVIHVSVDDPPGSPDVARIERIEDFLAADRASAYCVCRLVDDRTDAARGAVSVALGYVERRAPFDSAFDLSTPDALYCTELVWRAYREVGVDLADGGLDRGGFVGGSGGYLLPGTLLRSTALTLVESGGLESVAAK